jgi:uncharacterized protein YndB with AHSA1/START domain
MPNRSVTHATFAIERVYNASPARVFAAWAQPEAKARWFAGEEGWQTVRFELDFRVGGREVVHGGPPGGTVHAFDGLYQDIVPNERIIYTYDMHLDDKRISVSLATVEFKPEGAGTRLVFTEQGAFLDGFDDPTLREQGTAEMLDALGAELQRSAADA